MWRPGRIKSVRRPKAEGQALSGSLRDRIAVLLALMSVVCLGSVFFLSKGTRLLMPGPLTSAHGAIENCSACHTKSGTDKLSWLHGLVAGDPLADSKACLACHKMPDTALNAHAASTEVLKQSTNRLTKIAAVSPAPQSARAQNIAFPMHDAVAGGLFCATCHQEHQGVSFNLNRISNEQCRSCHVVKFDSFDGQHPRFENYPFERRTRIIYDHAGHFGKHFPEVAKKDPARRIPATCSTCHDSRADKRIMALAPFERTCTGCHLDQIIGKERASGPAGIAFLTLPGLDLQTLKRKNAPIGEWPDASEAALTPFMKVMISRSERGRALLKAVDSLNLQDLTEASDDQIKEVTNLVWEIKGLFHALIKEKASDVLGNLNVGGAETLSANLVADLTASIPRDVVVSAQQQWLPNLPAETANGPAVSTVTTESGEAGSTSPEELSGSDPPQATASLNAGDEAAAETDTPVAEVGGGKETRCADEPPRTIEAESEDAAEKAAPDGAADETVTPEAEPDGGEETLAADEEGGAINGRLPLPTGTPRAIEARIKAEKEASDGAAGKTDTAETEPDGCADEQPRAATGEADTKAATDGGEEALSADEQPRGKATDQSDDLLFPTEEELRASSADDVSKPEAKTPANASPDLDTAAADPQAPSAPAISIESNVDPESWAEYGGWYRQDYAIFYRPTGHKDKFIHSWLFLTGPHAPTGDSSPAAAVFDSLTGKDAQGSCTKCHSVDDIQGKGRVVNFSPPSVESKQGRFTNFIHEPHFGIMDDRGCLTCHDLEKSRPYLKSYEQGNPQNFAPAFSAVKKDLCQTCHASGMSRQDCLLCHKYHVNGVTTPIINTRNPAQ
jgi:hypothetical protein